MTRSLTTIAALSACMLSIACDRKTADEKAAAQSADAPASPAIVALADSLLPRLVRLSGLESKRPFTLRSQGPAAIRKYIETRLDHEMPAEKIASIRDTYALLGLVPDTLNLRALMLDLYAEQVVGYYDPTSRTMYVRDGADAAELRPVLAHELVHALQDQHASVDTLIGSDRGNDRRTAAHAALEGHATMVMFTLLAEDAEHRTLDPAQLPNPAEQLASGLDPENSPYPVFKRAPPIIRETLLFPYIAGADFMHRVWSADTGAHRAPLGDLLPESTEQLMHPDSRYLAARDTPTDLRFGDAAVEGWRVRSDETMGELETAIFLEQYLGKPGRAFAQGWDGDRYRMMQDTNGARALVWYSVWDNGAAADIFVSGMKQIALRRTGRSMTVDRVEIAGRPAVRIVDVAAGAVPPSHTAPSVVQLNHSEL